ncbi:MAG: hypothetical protein ACLQUY_12325 [Ktedonobacterales bacterium]
MPDMPDMPDMPYMGAIRAASANPEQLERLYQSARHDHETEPFARAILICAGSSPENLLYSAWYYRLQQRARSDGETERRSVNWWLAVEISLALGLAFWLLSAPTWQMVDSVPYLLLLWAPITAIALIGFVSLGGHRRYSIAIIMILAVVALTAYVLLVASQLPLATQKSYLDLMLVHVPLLAWGALGIAVLGWGSSAGNRFAFLNKSIETVGTAGVYAIALGIFIGITYGLFQTIGIEFPDIVTRLLLAGGAGLIPVMAAASVYDPQLQPSAQEFRRGFGRILAILMQALLPLTLIVLVVYLCLIPFNFSEPFIQRNVLIIYNIGLFGIMGLLVGVIPVREGDLGQRYSKALRLGIMAVATLATLVSLYALAAIIYRTAEGSLTMNRLVVIGWNTINIALLLALLTAQLRAKHRSWVEALQSVVRLGTVVYIIWAAFLVLALPWVF